MHDHTTTKKDCIASCKATIESCKKCMEECKTMGDDV